MGSINIGQGVPTIYHGTPLTPRAALNAVMPGRAACVSFFRPDDLEAVMAVCPQVMFRSRGVFLLDAGHARRARMGRGRPSPLVERLLRLAGTGPVHTRAMGDHARQSGCTIPAQRRLAERLAFRGSRSAGVAHGRATRSSGAPLREIRSRMRRLDRRPEERAGGLRGLFSAHGRGCRSNGQYVAPAAHAARDAGRSAISIRQRGQHQPCAERAPL